MDIVKEIVSALDVGIRLAFVYLILGLGAAAVQEAVAEFGHLRASNLKRALKDLLSDSELGKIDLAKEVLEHPLVHSGERGGTPSYITGPVFRLALLDVIARSYGPDHSKENAVEMSPTDLIASLPKKSKIRRIFEVLNAEAQASSRPFSTIIERLFSINMDAASTNYRFGTLKRLFGIAVILSVLANVNTFRVLEVLFAQAKVPPVVKSSIVQIPVAIPVQPGTVAIPVQPGTESLIGWNVGGQNLLVKALPPGTPPGVSAFLGFLADYAVGWLLTSVMVTVVAIALFDVLNKVIHIRDVSRPPDG